MKEEKDTALSNFRDSKNTMILATKAFGMGIDIDDIEVVYHYAPTGNLCDYVQEIGRAARKEDIVGTAKVDFFENDFRYINQLFGMSAIKNYQLIETLKKIRNIYLVKGQRNFTVSPDEFAYIFERKSNMDNIDSAFKTAMLMIQKDFERMPTVNFKPLIFKPRTLFTRAYVMIKPEVLKEMKKSPYRKYFKLYSSAQDMASKFTTKQSSYFYNANNHTIKQFNSCVKNTVTYLGDIYIVKLKELWEENFSDYSFAHFKYSFYQGELNYLGFAKDLLPEYLLTVNTSRHDFEKMISDFERIMDEIDNKLSITDITKSQLNLDDIAYIFESLESCELNHFESMIAANNFIEVINNYKANEQFNNNVVFKYNAATQRYIVQSVNLLRRRINYIINDCREKFQNVLQSNIKVFLIGSSSQGNDVGNSIQMKIALLLETFGLATYKVVSGERPEYFIRVNSVTAIEKIIDNQFYQSEMVQLVKFRHSESIRIMKKFFMELKTDKERWDYIEKYFSGMLKENE